MAINVQGLIQKSQQDAQAIRQSQAAGTSVQAQVPVSTPAVKPERKFMQGNCRQGTGLSEYAWKAV